VAGGWATDGLRARAVHSELAGNGIAVFGMDAHGHGRSEPRDEDDRALVHAFSHLVPVPKAPSPLRTVEC